MHGFERVSSRRNRGGFVSAQDPRNVETGKHASFGNRDADDALGFGVFVSNEKIWTCIMGIRLLSNNPESRL